MRTIVIPLLGALCVTVVGGAQTKFQRFFSDATLRVDYYHTGTKGEEKFSLDRVIKEGDWPGSRVNLVDTLNLGEYLARVYDRPTNELLYSRGFSTVFNEWQTTNEAAGGSYRTFSETVRIPYPRRAIQLTIARRDRKMEFREVFSTVIDPHDALQISRERPAYRFPAVAVVENGNPAEKVDIAVLGDGYAAGDLAKFRIDVQRMTDALFRTHPFKERKKDFNIWRIDVVSSESGIDVPDRNIWKNNLLGSRYDSFGSARYVLTEDNRTLRDIAAAAPYDFLCILVNDSRYGGGGIFNLYTTTYSREVVPGWEWQMEYMFVHEFGHSFGGLADEYYSSSTAYNDFYQPGIEPWEPNVTAFTDPERVKWKPFFSAGIDSPTPWAKSRYDSVQGEWRKLDRLAPDYYEKYAPIHTASTEILKSSRNAGKVGVFEGAGYASRGLYRPAVDCRMFSLSLSDFDPVCASAISRVIDFYTVTERR